MRKNTRVVLIVPSRVERSEFIPRWFRAAIPHLTPLGMVYLATVLVNEGFETIIMDQLALDIDNDELVKKVAWLSPDIVGFSVVSSAMPNTEKLAKAIRITCPHALLVFGNLHASYFAEPIVSDGLADVVVHGEGEEALLEIANAVRKRRDLGDIKGITFRDGTQVITTPSRSPLDIDSLPLPRWELLDIDLPVYKNDAMFGIYGRNVSIQASRGCPYRCIYCSHDKVFKGVRRRRIEAVVDEIEYVVKTYGVNQFQFYDSYFPWSVKSGLMFADEIKRRGLMGKIRFMTEMRVDVVDDEMIRQLKEVGLISLCLGFESGNQAVLDSIGKKTTIEQGLEAARIVKKHNVRFFGFFMMGFPGETEETCRDTIEYALKIDPDFMYLSIVMPYPGSRLFEMVRDKAEWRDFTRFTSWNYWDPSSRGLAYHPDEMTEEQLLRLHREAMFKFYVRPSVILRTLARGTLRPDHMVLGGLGVVASYVDGLLRSATKRHRRIDA